MKNVRTVVTAALFSTIVMLVSSIGAANDWGYADASVAKPKAYYDINVTTPETLRNFLWVIDGTFDTLVEKGACPSKIKMVVALRGASVKFVTSDYSKEDVDGTDLGEQIRGFLASLESKGVIIEACQISLDWMGVPAENLSGEVTVIDNALVAAMWYQQRRFSIFPITELPAGE